MPTNLEVYDRSILRAIRVERFKQAATRKVLQFLEVRVFRAILDAVPNILLDSAHTPGDVHYLNVARYPRLLTSLTTIILEGFSKAHSILEKEMRELAASEEKWQAALIPAAEGAPAPVKDSTPPHAMSSLAFEGVMLSVWWDRAVTVLRTGAAETALTALARGESASQIALGLQTLTHRSQSQVDALVRTALAVAVTSATQKAWVANPYITKWRFTAVLDARTSLTCASLDGHVWDIGSGPVPPLHFRCRSIRVPLLLGDIPGPETYEAWLRRQPLSVQEEVLGAAKAALFRKGVTLTAMTDRQHHPLTLAQIDALSNQA